MSKKKYLVIDTSDQFATEIHLYEGEQAMQEAIKDESIDDIEVYEVVKQVKLIEQPALVMDES
jgi:hypothetical protein